MRKGYSMIELVFVIVIIGVLAGISLPMVIGNVVDAKISKELENTRNCKADAKLFYTAFGTDMKASDSEGCQLMVCSSFDMVGGIVTVADALSAEPYCSMNGMTNALTANLLRGTFDYTMYNLYDQTTP